MLQGVVRKLSSQLMVVVMIVALVGFLGLFLWQSVQIQKMQGEYNRQQADLAAVQERNGQLQEHLDFYKGPGYLLYVEKVAREALGLVKPGETVVLAVSDTNTASSTAGPSVANPAVKSQSTLQPAGPPKPKQNWQNWLQFFTGP